jgi:hypothetical protein
MQMGTWGADQTHIGTKTKKNNVIFTKVSKRNTKPAIKNNVIGVSPTFPTKHTLTDIFNKNAHFGLMPK